MITVGDLRKAIEGLPDSAAVWGHFAIQKGKREAFWSMGDRTMDNPRFYTPRVTNDGKSGIMLSVVLDLDKPHRPVSTERNG